MASLTAMLLGALATMTIAHRCQPDGACPTPTQHPQSVLTTLSRLPGRPDGASCRRCEFLRCTYASSTRSHVRIACSTGGLHWKKRSTPIQRVPVRACSRRCDGRYWHRSPRCDADGAAGRGQAESSPGGDRHGHHEGDQPVRGHVLRGCRLRARRQRSTERRSGRWWQ